MRSRLCKRCGAFHDLDAAWPAACLPDPPKASELAAPTVIRDTIDPLQSMLDGKLYTSKAALRKTYREAGVTEVGNDKPKPFVKPKPDRKKIRAAVDRAFSRAGLGA